MVDLNEPSKLCVELNYYDILLSNLNVCLLQNLVKKGFTVNIEEGAGEQAKFKNEDYAAAGAAVKVTFQTPPLTAHVLPPYSFILNDREINMRFMSR